MHLIFIRHGDPDYQNNTVTEKGKKEVNYLAKRISEWDVTDFYCSPYGRAQDTIKPALTLMNRNYEVKDWLKEFDWNVKDPKTKENRCAWDWLPEYFYSQKDFFDRNKWYKTKVYKSGNIKEHYSHVCSSFDSLLKEYGYNRISKNKAIYTCNPHFANPYSHEEHLKPIQENPDNRNIVFVCHLGVMFTIISHLTGISPVQLWQGFFIAPSSVTVLGAEERIPGKVSFRVQMLGDISHLNSNNEVASASGFFGNYTNF